MITTVAILGGHIQALGLVRQVKRLGLRTVIITDDRCSVARWSRDVDCTYIYMNKEELIGYIENLGKERQDVMLFPTSDDYIDLIVEHYNEWKKRLYLAIPSPDVVRLFSNKRVTYRFCEKNGIAHPKSYYPMNMDDVKDIAKQIEYPCVLKPGVMYSFHKLLGKKAFLEYNEDELLAKMREIQEKGFPIELMVIQEFMGGGASDLYSCGTFAVDGESLVDIQVNRIRQNPMTFGNSTTYCHSVYIPEIVKAAKEILRKTSYTGMGEVEFMYDKGEYKFLEINTRAWKWHTISNQRGFSFIGAWIGHLNGQYIELGNDKDVAWIERLTDTAVVLKEVIHRRMSLTAYLRTVCRKKESAVWSWRDPLPAIMYVLLSPILYIKRY